MNLVTPSSQPLGSFQASVYYSAYLGTQAQRALTLRTGLTGMLPKTRDPQAGKAQTSPGMPILQSWDLQKMKGDRVTVDMKGRFTTKPIMNDRDQLERKESLQYARDQVRLSLYTHNGDPGGIMTRQRNPHDTRMDVMDASVGWAVNLEDNLFMVHAFGARGTQTGSDWIIPTDDDPDFQEIIGNGPGEDGTPAGNPLLPPTRTRYSIPGGFTGVNTIDTTAVLTIAYLSVIRKNINNSQVPFSPVNSAEMSGKADAYKANSSLLIGFLTEDQFLTIKLDAGITGFTQMVNNANTRVDFNSHPAFADLERFLFAGILWFKIPRAIIFTPGSQVQQYNPTTLALETVTVNAALPAGSTVQRGLVMGAQALCVSYGDANPPPQSDNGGQSGEGTTEAMKSPYSWREDVRVGGSVLDIFVRMMTGYKKLRYNWKNNATGVTTAYDNGVYAFDTYQAATS